MHRATVILFMICAINPRLKKLFEEFLHTFNIQLITGIRSNVRNMLMSMMQTFARKRAIAETIIDQLKICPQLSIPAISVQSTSW